MTPGLKTLSLMLALAGFAALAAGCASRTATEAPAAERTADDSERPAARTTEGGSEFSFSGSSLVPVLPSDTIRAILFPEFVSRAEAEEWMGPDEMVLGLEVDGDARAYPVRILSWHEIVNDTVGGRPVAVTW